MSEPNRQYHQALSANRKLLDENARLKAEVDEARRGSGAGMGVMLELNNQLVAENERLKADVERLDNNCDYLDRKLDEEIDKSAMLCGQVERLRKAGDAMAKRTEFFQKRWDADELCQEVEAWNAAKEGKPTSNE